MATLVGRITKILPARHDLQKIQYLFSNEQAKEVNIHILLEGPLKFQAENVKTGQLHGYFK